MVMMRSSSRLIFTDGELQGSPSSLLLGQGGMYPPKPVPNKPHQSRLHLPQTGAMVRHILEYRVRYS